MIKLETIMRKVAAFEMESIYFPNNDEEYYLQGWRAKDYESSKLWIKYFNDKYIIKISELFQKKIQRDIYIYFKIYKYIFLEYMLTYTR